MSVQIPEACPCIFRCSDRRPKAVNIVLTNKVITSTELFRTLIDKEGLGKETARKNLHFLHHEDYKQKINRYGCRYITIVKKPTMHALLLDAVLYFRNKTRVFLSKDAPKEKVEATVESLLSNVQKDILKLLRSRIFGPPYLSSYEIRKLVPEKGDRLSLGLKKLLQIGFIKKHVVNSELPGKVLGSKRKRLDFFTMANEASLFESKLTVEAEIGETTEMRILIDLQRVLRYSNGEPFLVSRFKDTIRKTDEKLLSRANRMTFDMLLPLEEAYDGKTLLAVDAYTRFPVTAEVLGRFVKKVKKAKNAVGLIFARQDLPNELTETFVDDHVFYIVIEHVSGLSGRSINCRKIRERVEKIRSDLPIRR